MNLFRVARPASWRWNLTKTLAQTSVFWATLLWIVPSALARFEEVRGVHAFHFPGQSHLGWLVLALGSLGGLWSGITMAVAGSGTPLPIDTARSLIVRGPYRFVRNPMAVFGISQGLGVSAILGSPIVLGYVVAGALLWHVLVRPIEERDLTRRFGQEYESYRSRVGLWLPRRRAT